MRRESVCSGLLRLTVHWPRHDLPMRLAGLSQRGHVTGDREEGDGNWATGLRSPQAPRTGAGW